MRPIPTLLLTSCAVLGLGTARLPEARAEETAARGDRLRVYIGTYTGEESQGIYLLRLEPETGKLSGPVLAAKALHPSFLALHPSGRFLYAANETGSFEGQKSGAVTAFAVDAATGLLEQLDQKPSGGEAPCHVTVDRSGRSLLVANYMGGSVAVFRIGEDGRLGERTAFSQHQGSSVNRQRQETAHAHSVNLDAANRFAFVADLGIDKIVAYRFDPSKGTLERDDSLTVSLEPGSGPRHFAFHPEGRRAYAINELASTIAAFSYDAATGKLETTQTISTLPKGFFGASTTAEVRVSPDGKLVFGSNRGHDSIAVFRVEADGKLTPTDREPTGGKTPRNFGIDPSGKWLLAANQGTGTVVVFRIDSAKGALEPTGRSVAVPSPVCVLFAPDR